MPAALHNRLTAAHSRLSTCDNASAFADLRLRIMLVCGKSKIFLFLNIKKAIDFLSIFKGKSLQFLFEKVAAASAAEHLPWVTVYEVLGHGGIVLGFILHTLSLGKVATQQFVIVLIAAALVRGLRVAVVGSQAEGIQSCLVGKFAAVVARQGLKQQFEVFPKLTL